MEPDFSDKESKIYVIDTSGLIKLDLTFPSDNAMFSAIWEELEDLISQGRMRIIDHVEDEINSYEGQQDFLKKWVKKWRRLMVVETDIESYNAAIPIINEEYSTGFFDAKKQAVGKEEADPYLIAYCKVHNCTLVTNENKTKPNKIPQVSQKNGVSCIDVYEFLSDTGLRMERKKI